MPSLTLPGSQQGGVAGKPTTPTMRRKGLSDLINREQRRLNKQQQQQQQADAHQLPNSKRKKMRKMHTLMATSNLNILDAGLKHSKSEVDLHGIWARDGTPRWWIGKDYVNFIIKVGGGERGVHYGHRIEKKTEKNSPLLTHFPTSEGVSK